MASVRDEMGDEGLSELVDMLLRDVAESSAAFRELADAGQFAEIGRQAHRLKGSCRVLGFDQLAALYDELELLPTGPLPGRTHILANEIEDQLLGLLRWWRSINSQLPTPNANHRVFPEQSNLNAP